MAITTLAGVQSGQQWTRQFHKQSAASLTANALYSSWKWAGYPDAGTQDYTTNDGITLSSSSTPVLGQVDYRDPVSGNSYLARLQASIQNNNAAYGGILFLCDRLWQCGKDHAGTAWDAGAAINSNITSPTWPARDNNGSTNGEGVLLGIEIGTSKTFNAGAATITITYTNSAGTGSRTGGSARTIPTSGNAAVGYFIPITLQAGDVGVRSVQNFTTSGALFNATSNSTAQLVAYRVIAAVDIQQSGYTGAIDALTSGFPTMSNGTVPFFLSAYNAAGIGYFFGSLMYSQG